MSVKRGDLLLVSSKCDPISWLIMLGTHSKISHTVWILDKKWCLESVGTGIKKSPLTKYLSNKGKFFYKCRFFRLKKASKDKINRAIKNTFRGFTAKTEGQTFMAQFFQYLFNGVDCFHGIKLFTSVLSPRQVRMIVIF